MNIAVHQYTMWHYTDDHFDTESFNDDYNILVNTAISKYDNVVISSICPRLDDTHGNDINTLWSFWKTKVNGAAESVTRKIPRVKHYRNFCHKDLRERPFNLKGGLWFFSKKIF